MKRLINKPIIILLCTLAILLSIFLAACSNKNKINFSNLIEIKYDCMGGHIDKLPTRTLLSKPNSYIIEPKGTSGFVAPQKEGYSLEGWYTKYAEGNYFESENGEYVYSNLYTKNETGSYVRKVAYFPQPDGEYVAKKAYNSTNLIYELYNKEDETHEGLDRFRMAYIYVKYEETEEEHKTLPRYSAEKAYVLYDELNPEHEGLKKYIATFTFSPSDKWDFDTMKIGTVPIVLYANWVKNLSISWVFNDKDNRVVTHENGVLGVVLEKGKKIKETTIIPKKEGYTFTYWYKNKQLTERWDFEQDVFPVAEDFENLNLYAGYVQGEYNRIVKNDDLLQLVYKNTESFILLRDLTISESLNKEGAIFSGNLNGFGHTLTGLSLVVYNNSKIGTPKSFGLFSILENAIVENLNIEIKIEIKETSNKALMLGGIAGEDREGSVIKNCNVDVKISVQNGGTTQSDLYLGAFVGVKSEGEKPTQIIESTYNEGTAFSVASTGIIKYAD